MAEPDFGIIRMTVEVDCPCGVTSAYRGPGRRYLRVRCDHCKRAWRITLLGTMTELTSADIAQEGEPQILEPTDEMMMQVAEDEALYREHPELKPPHWDD